MAGLKTADSTGRNVLYSFGRVDDPAVVERLRKLAHSILRRCCYEQWLREDIRIDGTAKLELQHLYRPGLPRGAQGGDRGGALLPLGGPLPAGRGSHLLRHHVAALRGGRGGSRRRRGGHRLGQSERGRQAVRRAPQAGLREERPARRPADRGGAGGEPRRAAGAALGLPGQHRGRDDREAGQTGSPGLEAGPLRLRRGRGDGQRRQPAEARSGRRQVHRSAAARWPST